MFKPKYLQDTPQVRSDWKRAPGFSDPDRVIEHMFKNLGLSVEAYGSNVFVSLHGASVPFDEAIVTSAFSVPISISSAQALRDELTRILKCMKVE